MAPMVVVEPTTLYEAEAAFRRQFVTMTLEAECGNRARAAQHLGIQRTYLYRIIKVHGIVVPFYRRIVPPHGEST